jgi:hypothetical protein
MFQALFLPFASPVCDWECKGTKCFFNLQILFSIKIKFFVGINLFSLPAGSFFRFGSAKVRRLFDFPSFSLKTFGSVFK